MRRIAEVRIAKDNGENDQSRHQRRRNTPTKLRQVLAHQMSDGALAEKESLPGALFALLLKFSEMPDQFEVVDQTQRVHSANFVLGLVKRVGNIFITRRVKVQDVGLRATDECGVEREMFRGSRVDIWKATRPVDRGDHSGFKRNFFLESLDSVTVFGDASEMRCNLDEFLECDDQLAIRPHIVEGGEPKRLGRRRATR